MGNAQPITRVNRQPNPYAFPGYIVCPNGGQVFYVSSLGIQDETTADIASQLYPTLTAALNVSRANRGDTIICLPGHTENIATTSPTFKAGVRVVGVGNGDERPTFNWNVAGSAWSIAVANFSIENCVLDLSSAASTTVTKAITIAGASASIERCRIRLGASATQLVTTGIELTTGADKFRFVANDVFSTANAANVDVIKMTNAIDRARFEDNIISCGMSTTTSSVITMTTAPTNIYIGFNSLNNSIANSTKSLVGIASATGFVEYNNVYIMAATGAAAGIGTPGALQFNQNFGTAGTTNTSGILTPGTPAT